MNVNQIDPTGAQPSLAHAAADAAAGPLQCELCGGGVLEPFLAVEGVPVHVGVLWPSAEAARSCAKGDLVLALCRTCGFVANTAFDPDLIDYGQKYDNALHSSPFFQQFEHELAKHLMERYGLRGGTIAEIGCGSGHFLGLICRLGNSKGIGFDPSHDPVHADPLAAGRVEFVREHFSAIHAERTVNLLCCRQTLEHIADPRLFLTSIRGALSGRDTVVYFEVPNSTMPFRDLSIWDLIYEHCTYFVAPSLRHLFEAVGFEVLDLRETYEGQFLSLEARPADREPTPRPAADALDEHIRSVSAFGDRFGERRNAWRQRLASYARLGTRAVVWGGGARAVSFFNMLDIREQIEFVVDINPRKQGSYLGGTGQRIVAPRFLREYEPDVVILLNPLYRDEIAYELATLGVDVDLVPA